MKQAIPGLDGIRAIALLLVFFSHSGLENYVPGGLGVTLFFVLSGYLITTLLRSEQLRDGRINLRHFYLRRLLRLSPPLLLVIAVSGVLAAIGFIDGQFTTGGLLASVFYVGNYFLIQQDFHGMPDGLSVIWSLAIEEHFYLFFPPLAVLLLRLGKPRWSMGLLLGCCALVLGWRCWLALLGASDDYLMMATDTRIDAILIGCAMALGCNPWLDPVPTLSRRQVLAIGVLSLGVLAGTLLFRDVYFRGTFRYSLQALAIAPLIYLAVARHKSPLFGWLGSRALAYLGTISYTAYLAHHLILVAVVKHWPEAGWAVTTATAAILTLAVAELVRRAIERPLLALRQRLRAGHGPARQTATAAVVLQ
jgi:peptidoglycan/LPS O-acetylase OafA/YrhL